MGKRQVKKCCICGKPLRRGEWGNNPKPVKQEGVCCDICHMKIVVPARVDGDWVVRDKEPL